MGSSKWRVCLALGVGVAVPLLVGLIVPHDVTPIGLARTPMLAAIVFATLVGGLLPGAIAAVAAVLASAYWFVPPYDSLSAVKNGDDLVSLLLFVVVAFSAVALVRLLVARASREAVLRGRVEARFDAEHEAVETLQRALLPRDLPTVHGVVVDARYVGAARPDLLGGDWYVVMPVGSGCLGLAVGDVAGHGLDAAAAMAELRFATKAFMTITASPCVVLEHLNDMLLRSSRGLLSSATVGVLDLDRGTWTEAVAGHPPTLLRDAQGSTHVLLHEHGPLLGIRAGVRFPEHRVPFGAGWLLALYTDGLVERHGERIDDGIERLRSVLCGLGSDTPSVASDLLQHLAPAERHDDIVVVTAACSMPQDAPSVEGVPERRAARR